MYIKLSIHKEKSAFLVCDEHKVPVDHQSFGSAEELKGLIDL